MNAEQERQFYKAKVYETKEEIRKLEANLKVYTEMVYTEISKLSFNPFDYLKEQSWKLVKPGNYFYLVSETATSKEFINACRNNELGLLYARWGSDWLEVYLEGGKIGDIMSYAAFNDLKVDVGEVRNLLQKQFRETGKQLDIINNYEKLMD